MVGAGERRRQDRSVATRTALLDAALATVIERGYARTTTIEVARRAGVSRGAQLHHFPAKVELVTAAVGHLLDRRIAEFRSLIATVDPGEDRLEAGLDLLWSMFEGPTFAIWVELWVAARTDRELAVLMADMDRRFTDESRAVMSELLSAELGGDSILSDIGRDFAFALMTGVALQRLVPRSQRPAREYIDALKQVFEIMRTATAGE